MQKFQFGAEFWSVLLQKYTFIGLKLQQFYMPGPAFHLTPLFFPGLHFTNWKKFHHRLGFSIHTSLFQHLAEPRHLNLALSLGVDISQPLSCSVMFHQQVPYLNTRYAL